MRVPYDEGVANHIGPESCAGVREGVSEALTGSVQAKLLSRENDLISGADAFRVAEGNTDGHVNASARPARRGRRTWHVRTLFVREPGGLTVDQQRAYTCCAGPHRGGEEP